MDGLSASERATLQALLDALGAELLAKLDQRLLALT